MSEECIMKKSDELDTSHHDSCEPRHDTSHNLNQIINSTDQIPAIIVITDATGIIQYVNRKFTEITGYSNIEVIGKTPAILKSGYHPDEFYRHMWNTISSKKMWAGEFYNKKKTGELYWEHATISPAFDAQRNITNFIAVKQEITNRKEMEYNLKIKENALLSSINAIVLTDLNGNITYVNPSFLGMWNFDSEQRILQKPVFSLWKKGGQYVNIIDQILRDGGWFGEVIAKGNDGRLFPVQMSASMVKDEFDKLLCIMASFVDVTKQKRLEKKYKRFKTISDEADYGAIIHDMDGTILYVNKSFAFIHGYYPQDIIGKNLSIFYAEDKAQDYTTMINELKTVGNVVGKELYHITKNGDTIPLLMTSTVIKETDYQNPYVAGTVIDITERKESEKKILEHTEVLREMNNELQVTREQLSTLNQNLEIEVEQRTQKIRKLVEQKDGFITQLSHDLKTPLTPIMALLPILKDSLRTEKEKEILDVIIKNTYFMKDLVEKTIDLAKFNSDRIDIPIETIELKSIMDKILTNNKVMFKEKNIKIENGIADGLYIKGNELRLYEVFNNILTNSVKYIGENEKRITIQATKEQDMVQISFSDSGIGMTQEQIDRIFDEFYKADSSRHDHNSTGLGLSITKKIVEKHGGVIWAESQGLGGGSTFFIRLKAADNKDELKKSADESEIYG